MHFSNFDDYIDVSYNGHDTISIKMQSMAEVRMSPSVFPSFLGLFVDGIQQNVDGRVIGYCWLYLHQGKRLASGRWSFGAPCYRYGICRFGIAVATPNYGHMHEKLLQMFHLGLQL